jgi:hypothetical protein
MKKNDNNFITLRNYSGNCRSWVDEKYHKVSGMGLTKNTTKCQIADTGLLVLKRILTVMRIRFKANRFDA